MCTAINFSGNHHYFGRTLDLEYRYHEQVVITPRRFAFPFRRVPAMTGHFAMIGMATVIDQIPLYYEATNEHGVSMAGLNFPQSAHYFPPVSGKDNVAPFEFIPWILGQCRNMNEVHARLAHISLLEEAFSATCPVTPLHWLISWKNESIVVESTADGLHVYDNPVQVMTNNPPFSMQLWNLANYPYLSPRQPEAPALPGVKIFSNGLGASGLPGDWSSASRFVRAAYTLHTAVRGEDTASCVTRFFQILDTVSIPRGCVLTEGKPMITLYASCCDADTGIYYYTTCENRRITAVSMHHEALDSAQFICYPISEKQQILLQNRITLEKQMGS